MQVGRGCLYIGWEPHDGASENVDNVKETMYVCIQDNAWVYTEYLYFLLKAGVLLICLTLKEKG